MQSIKLKSRLGVVAALVALAVSVVASAAVAGSRSGPEPRQQQRNLVETAVAAGSFKTLTSLVKQAGLADTLATGGRFTVFAPTEPRLRRSRRRRSPHWARTAPSSGQCSSTT